MDFLVRSFKGGATNNTLERPPEIIHSSSELLVYGSTPSFIFDTNKLKKVIVLGDIIGFSSEQGIRSSKDSVRSFLKQKIESSNSFQWINHLEGRFVLIIIDYKNNFWISTDKFGKKDVYYQKRKNGMDLSSDMSFLNQKVAAAGYDQSAIAHSLSFYGYRPPKKHTIYNDIRRLGVGEIAESIDGQLKIIKLKVELPSTREYNHSDHKTYKENFLGYLEATGSKEGNIVYLSSGWDSTSILAGLIHVFGKKSVRGVIGKMLYSERSGNCNIYEMERAQKFADYYGISLTVTELNYAQKGLENFSKVEEIFLSNQFHSFTGVNHFLLAEAANEMRNGNESIFAGEISDGAHNFGFSQYASIFHPSLDFREYSDKMATYLFGPTFTQLILQGHHLDDPIYKLFLEKNNQSKFDPVEKDQQEIMRQVFQSMFIRNGRLPLWSGKNISMLREEGLESYTQEMTKTYFNDFVDIEMNQLYSSFLHLYNSFHWQGSTVATLQTMCDKFEMNSYLPFWGNNIQEFLSLMPESWGRGLDFNRTKYPLKEMLDGGIDYPIGLQEGPHSYTYDVDHSFNHNNELIYHSALNPMAKDLLKQKNYQSILSDSFFDIDYLDRLVDQFVDSEQPLEGSEREDLVSLFLFSKTGWYN